MAYAAVASLLQTLEDLLRFPCIILEFKIARAKTFYNEIYPVLRILKSNLKFSKAYPEKFEEEVEVPEPSEEELSDFEIYQFGFSDFQTYCGHLGPTILEETIEPLLLRLKKKILQRKRWQESSIEHWSETLPGYIETQPEYIDIKNFDVKVLARIFEITERIFGFYRGTPTLSEKTLGILEQIMSQISEDLEFIAETLNTFPDESNSFKSFLEVALSILLDSQSFLQEITFSYEVILQIMFFCKNLQFFLSFFEDSSGKFCDPQVVRSLKNVADKAGNFIEDCMMGSPMESEMKCIWILVAESAILLSREGINRGKEYETISDSYLFLELEMIHERVENIFDGEKGIRQYLFQALEEIQQLKGEITKTHDKPRSLLAASTSLPKGSSLRNSKQNIVVGLDDEKIGIMEGLTRLPSGLEIVTIVGMGGIGKTTLARQIFHHPFIDYHFPCRAWIIVSQVYNVRNLLLGLLSSVAPLTDEVFEKNNAQLAEKLYRSLQGQRYLIVMDDMWSISAWNDVKRCFPDEKIGSRIIVTSRFTELAIHTNPWNPPHCMNLLDSVQSWELLEKLVFGQEVCPPQLANVGKEIAGKCKGLPLAIVVVAGLLSEIRTHKEWTKVADCVRSNVCNDPEQFLDILALSYKYLPHNLKACFLYMGAFPEDCEIVVRKLIQIWIADGLINPRSSENLEEIAEGFLKDLIDRNLITVGRRSFSGKVKTCRLHDLLQELCLREARKEDFMTVLKGEDQCFPPDASNQRRFSFQLNADGYVHLAPPYPHLRSFLCFTLGSDFVPDILFASLNFKLLRVLDMFFLQFDFFPSQIVELANLRYLALKVSFELPTSISKLCKLQTLFIHGPWNCRKGEKIQTLSFEYWNMPGLRHLYITVASCLANPSSVWDSQLKRYMVKPESPRYMQTLSTISFASCKREVFSVMPHLKKLSICETKADYHADSSSDCLKNLVYLQELETLKCSFYLEREREQRNFCWNAIPSGLKKLTLSRSYLPWKNMTFLAKLPNLEVLKLKRYAFQGPEWEPTEAGFRCLKHLLIETTDLAVWEATSNDFPSLQQLILKSCDMLLEIPYDVRENSALQRLELHYCSESAEMSAKKIEQVGLDIVIRSNWRPDSA